MHCLRALGAVLLLVLPISANTQTSERSSGPALWVASNGSSTVYLLGRMPVRSDTEWFTAAIELALTESDVLWLENPRGDPAQADALVAQYGFEEGYSVIDVLDQRTRSRVVSILERADMSRELLLGRKPWLAYLMLTNAIDRVTDIDGPASPDSVFRDRAESAGKEVRSEWQDIEEFMRFAIALPDTVHVQLIGKAVDDAESYDQFLEAWATGDIDRLSEIGTSWASNYPDAYRRIASERNAKWTAYIEEMLTSGGTHFVSIGVGHVIGPENVRERLEAAGVSLRRL